MVEAFTTGERHANDPIAKVMQNLRFLQRIYSNGTERLANDPFAKKSIGKLNENMRQR